MPDSSSGREERVLIVAPTGADAATARDVLAEVGIVAEAHDDVAHLARSLPQGAGAVLIASEALAYGDNTELAGLLEAQPAWSDVPLIVLTHVDSAELAARIATMFGARANLVFLERPCRAATLVSSVRSALRSRRRQYEMRELLRQEQTARAEIERAARIKDEFLATLSHELRTPLNAIVGWSHVLMTRPTENDPDLQKGLEVIDRNARAQARLIEDLLDMSAIMSGKTRLSFESVDVRAVVTAAVESLQPAAQSKGILIEVTLDTPLFAMSADPQRLQQCFWNLLSNAIKFSKRDGRVRVQLAHVGGGLEFSVEDDGEGIAPQFLPHVFERFRQGDASSTKRHRGLGLGLSIVKTLVELHGGTVSAHSEGPGRGARFTIRLPLISAAGRETDAGSGGLGSASLEGLTVLAVDDDSDARQLVRRVLEEYGARVVLAASAKEGLELVRAAQPDLIVSDIGMADIDGYQFLREVRALPPDRGGRTPAAALSAFTSAADTTRAKGAGYQIHLAKPIDCTELATELAKLVVRDP